MVEIFGAEAEGERSVSRMVKVGGEEGMLLVEVGRQMIARSKPWLEKAPEGRTPVSSGHCVSSET